MTDRIHSLTVVLGEDMRADDADGLVEAIRRFRNVVSVTPNVTNILDEHVAKMRLRIEVSDMLQKFLAGDRK